MELGTWNLELGRSKRGGYAALTVLLVTLAVSLTIIAGFAFFTLQEIRSNRAFTDSLTAHAAAEAGVEDGLLRFLNGKQLGSSETLSVGNGSAVIIRTATGNVTTLRAEGTLGSLQQNQEVRVKIVSDAASFPYALQAGSGGITMDNNAVISGGVYAEGTVRGANGAHISGDAAVTEENPPALGGEWTNNNADYPFATQASNQDVAQSFTPTASGALTKVSVLLGKTGGPGAGLTLRIVPDSGGNPSNSELASKAIPPADVPQAPAWVDVVLPAPPTLTNGTTYWILLDYDTKSTTNYWNWRKDTSDGYPNNTGKFTGDWTNKKASWSAAGGDFAFRVWLGGQPTGIESVTVGDAASGAGRASYFSDAVIHGSSCPNPYCIVDNPPAIDLPVSEQTIEKWRNDAAEGGVISGDFEVTTDASLGPKKITGDLLVTANNKTLIISGTIFVQGNIAIDNGSVIRCDPAYGQFSCVVVSNGWIHIQNNGTLGGSGQAGSFIILASDLACDGSSSAGPCGAAHHNGAIDLHNNAVGAIFYAPAGLINLHNGVEMNAGAAKKLALGQNATVSYGSNLAEVNFASDPSVEYDILSWIQTE